MSWKENIDVLKKWYEENRKTRIGRIKINVIIIIIGLLIVLVLYSLGGFTETKGSGLPSLFGNKTGGLPSLLAKKNETAAPIKLKITDILCSYMQLFNYTDITWGEISCWTSNQTGLLQCLCIQPI